MRLTICTMLLGLASVAAAQDAVDIQWSSLGIPHIQAADERGLGLGIGYAYAQDNACLLADEILTARGERAEFHGAQHVQSDVFYRWLNSEQAVATFWQAQPPAMKQLLEGYAAGFNRYLREGSAPSCRGAAWVRPISEQDLVRMIRRLLVEGGLAQFAEAVASAAPPGAAQAQLSRDKGLAAFRAFCATHGSNAIALGAERTENGKGRLLGNPHFPWSGAHRFYEMHLTIPGVLDVMGAALPGLPVVNIGFSRHVAWTHTVDKASHFTLHRLALDPKNPLRYFVDGKPHTLQKTPIKLKVRGQGTRTHTVYESVYGPVIAVEGELSWTRTQAYALKDANLGNTRVPEQWYAMNRAGSLAALQKAVQSIGGIPWVNTVAADDRGQALFMDVSVVPDVPLEKLSECADPALQAAGLPGLDGSRSACSWQSTVPGAKLPVLQRRDFVQNSNDSAWLSNPASPLVGFSPLVSATGSPLGLRTRYALDRLTSNKAAISEAKLRALVTDNRVYLADLVLDDLLAFCKTQQLAACQALAAWDRSAGLAAGPGMQVFEAFGLAFLELESAWRVAFDPEDALHTPRGIAWQRPEVAEQLRQALSQIAPSSKRWGEVQGVARGESFIPIPGGDSALGVYNAIQSAPPNAAGKREVYSGSSYIQLVSFDEAGPVAQGLLTFSQASEPTSPHARDQTELFSKQRWHALPFTAEQLEADPPTRQLTLR
jgi:acyl-homoserine-lactone acylase